MRFEPVLRIGKQGRVAAKPIHDGAQAECSVGRRKQAPDTGKLSEYAAAVDVADEHPAAVQVAAGPQIDEVALQEIQLHRAAGSLHHQHIAALMPAVEDFRDRLPQSVEMPVVLGRGTVTLRLAEHDDLRSLGTAGLEQYGIHLHRGNQAAGLRLHGLRAADFSSLQRDPGVIGHVLRLEGGDTNSLAAKPRAKRGRDPAFTRAGSAAENR